LVWGEEVDRHAAQAWSETQSLSLVQRADLQKPAIPSLVSKATQLVHEPGYQRNSQRKVEEITRRNPRSQRISEFVVEKREIFLIQLMIDKKLRELEELSGKVKIEEEEFEESEKHLERLSEEYKHKTVQCEADVAAGRIAAEAATTRRIDLQRKFKLSTQKVAEMRAQIRRNEQTLELYRGYRVFLGMVEEMETRKIGKDPEDLLDIFAGIEGDNMFLMEQYDVAKETIGRGVDPLAASLATIERQLEVVEKKQVGVLKSGDFVGTLSENDIKMAHATETELHRLENVVRRAYLGCFRTQGDGSAMGLLEQIESGLERMYAAVETINPVWFKAKQKEREEERLEQRRIARAERKAAELKTKMEHALARATRPVRRRNGRPAIRRMMPVLIRPVDEEKVKAERRERRRIEALLYEDEES
jgi:hypothetical protein